MMTANGVAAGQSLDLPEHDHVRPDKLSCQSLGRFPEHPDDGLVEEDGDDRRDDEEGDKLVDGDSSASPGMTVHRGVLGALEHLHLHRLVVVQGGPVGVYNTVDVLSTSHHNLSLPLLFVFLTVLNMTGTERTQANIHRDNTAALHFDLERKPTSLNG